MRGGVTARLHSALLEYAARGGARAVLRANRVELMQIVGLSNAHAGREFVALESASPVVFPLASLQVQPPPVSTGRPLPAPATRGPRRPPQGSPAAPGTPERRLPEADAHPGVPA